MLDPAVIEYRHTRKIIMRFFAKAWIMTSYFYYALTANIEVNIVTLGYDSPVNLAAFAYTGPPLEMAIERVRQMYRETFNFSLTYIRDTKIPDCETLVQRSDYMLSKWYYTERREESVTALIIPGCPGTRFIGALTAAWNTLLITSVSAENAIRNKLKNPTWISFAYIAFSQYIQLYLSILARHNWTSVFLIVDDNSVPFYANVASLFMVAYTSTNTQKRQLSTRRIASKNTVDYQRLLDEFRGVSRVLLFFGHSNGLRQLVVTAALANMTNGEYVYMAVEPLPKSVYGNMTWKYGLADDQIAKEAFRSVLVIQPLDSAKPLNVRHQQLGAEILKRSELDYNFSYPIVEQPFRVIIGPYAAVNIFTEVLNSTHIRNPSFNFKDGKALAQLFIGKTFTSEVGDISFDDVGERQLDFVVSYFDSSHDVLTPFLLAPAASTDLLPLVNITWVGDIWPPLNEPKCGYLNQRASCQPKRNKDWLYGGVLGSLSFVILAIVALSFFVKRRVYEAELLNRWYEIREEQLSFPTYSQSRVRMQSLYGTRRSVLPSSLQKVPVAFDGKDVYLTKIKIDENIETKWLATAPNRRLLMIFKQLREIAHDNVNEFYGIANVLVSRDLGFVFVTAFCHKATIHDLFESSVELDAQFTASLIVDLLEGAEYLHKTVFGYHGHMTSNVCLVDKFFTLKICGFAFDCIRHELSPYSTKTATTLNITDYRQDIYWSAPELLRNMSPPNQKTDIYAVGVILFEILTKEHPFHKVQLSSKSKMIALLSEGQFESLLMESGSIPVPEKALSVLRTCWEIVPANRPSAYKLKTMMLRSDTLAGFKRRGKLIDRMIRRMELYSEELECDVAERTEELIEERRRCDSLLAEILPKIVVKQLRSGSRVDAEKFDLVTILFSDVHGFIDFVARNSMLTVIKALMDIESIFDRILERFDVYKVEGVGDTYMVASGVPFRNDNRHASEICTFSLTMMATCSEFAKANQLYRRIGIHTGSCATGVIGFRHPRYCLFGDTVNTASRMCSHGEHSRIHLSSETALFIKESSQFILISRGLTAIKGKNQMLTFWLESNIY